MRCLFCTMKSLPKQSINFEMRAGNCLLVTRKTKDFKIEAESRKAGSFLFLRMDHLKSSLLHISHFLVNFAGNKIWWNKNDQHRDILRENCVDFSTLNFGPILQNLYTVPPENELIRRSNWFGFYSASVDEYSNTHIFSGSVQTTIRCRLVTTWPFVIW